MATFAVTIVDPINSTRRPDGNGLLQEIWRVTGDGSTTTATLTPTTLRGILSITGSTTLTHNVAPPTSGLQSTPATATLTWGTALGDGLYQDILVLGY